MNKRTWPYGTRIKVKVEMVHRLALVVTGLEEAHREGFILMGPGLANPPGEGSVGFITFTEGGPTGGHWVFSES